MNTLVKATDVQKVYTTGGVAFEALKGVSLAIEEGCFWAIMGHSGSGKSTLLHLIGGLDQPTAGSVRVNEHDLTTMNETELAKFRRKHIGFIFQFFNLVDNLSVRANVELPALLANSRNRSQIRTRSDRLLERLGIDRHADKHPWELSGGEQQRVAIARALINAPTLLLADEPTGNLDSNSGERVLRILQECHESGQTILMVTHDPLAAAEAKRVLFLHDGEFVGALPGGDPEPIAKRMTELK